MTGSLADKVAPDFYPGDLIWAIAARSASTLVGLVLIPPHSPARPGDLEAAASSSLLKT